MAARQFPPKEVTDEQQRNVLILRIHLTEGGIGTRDSNCIAESAGGGNPLDGPEKVKNEQAA